MTQKQIDRAERDFERLKARDHAAIGVAAAKVAPRKKRRLSQAKANVLARAERAGVTDGSSRSHLTPEQEWRAMFPRR